ncbi:MAG: hypothetical protein AB7I36_08410 [Rhodospirillaceae bacterium]
MARKPMPDGAGPPTTFDQLVRTIVTTCGTVAMISGMLGIFVAVLRNLGSPALQPTTAILGGAVLFFGGFAMVLAVWLKHITEHGISLNRNFPI